MSNRTHACLACRRLYRKPQALVSFACPVCRSACVRVHWKLHVPAPRKVKKWNKFWAQYLLELRQLAEFRASPHLRVLRLPLLNQQWTR